MRSASLELRSSTPVNSLVVAAMINCSVRQNAPPSAAKQASLLLTRNDPDSPLRLPSSGIRTCTISLRSPRFNIASKVDTSCFHRSFPVHDSCSSRKFVKASFTRPPSRGVAPNLGVITGALAAMLYGPARWCSRRPFRIQARPAHGWEWWVFPPDARKWAASFLLP